MDRRRAVTTSSTHSRAQASLPVRRFVRALDVVAAAAPPRDVAQVQAVVDAVVDEGRQAVLIDRIPQAQLGRDAIVEPHPWTSA